MPNLDGTGPQGQGPRTGRGMGNCPANDKNLPTNNRRPLGQGGGLGRGFRQGGRRRLV